ncbi:hypothetical protein [Microtetraspora niveoalba]|uniref:hypothetical protein n=1 Tax=Microtetraspora niveoalba TaxID=46175 RepID=UPI0008341546|nr:hypothetical protein [Microtetraspora niveoalba]
MHFHGTNRLLRIKARLDVLTGQADRDLCVDQDWWAHRLGWTVTRTGFGARHYRDPRFDLVLELEEAAPPAK